MAGGVRVFRRVTVWRGIATERRATCLTGSQMNPVAADLHTFLTLALLRSLQRRNRLQV